MKADCSENDDDDEEKEEDRSYIKTGWYGASYYRIFGFIFSSMIIMGGGRLLLIANLLSIFIFL